MHDKLLPSVEKEIMTLAERLREEGETQGKLEGKLEVAKRMLDAGSDPVFVVKVTGLTLEQVQKLQ